MLILLMFLKGQFDIPLPFSLPGKKLFSGKGKWQGNIKLSLQKHQQNQHEVDPDDPKNQSVQCVFC